jgi:hypothetical protein
MEYLTPIETGEHTYLHKNGEKITFLTTIVLWSSLLFTVYTVYSTSLCIQAEIKRKTLRAVVPLSYISFVCSVRTDFRAYCTFLQHQQPVLFRRNKKIQQ